MKMIRMLRQVLHIAQSQAEHRTQAAAQHSGLIGHLLEQNFKDKRAA